MNKAVCEWPRGIVCKNVQTSMEAGRAAAALFLQMCVVDTECACMQPLCLFGSVCVWVIEGHASLFGLV